MLSPQLAMGCLYAQYPFLLNKEIDQVLSPHDEYVYIFQQYVDLYSKVLDK